VADQQNAILAKLVRAAPRPVAIEEIMPVVEAAGAHAQRKNTLTALGKLMQKNLVVRANRPQRFNDTTPPEYVATPAGVAFVKSGKRIQPGNRGPRGLRRNAANTFRQRIWNAFRIQKKATIPELAELAREKGDGDAATRNAQAFLNSLCKAGIAARLPGARLARPRALRARPRPRPSRAAGDPEEHAPD
jgi:hypothetical protein